MLFQEQIIPTESEIYFVVVYLLLDERVHFAHNLLALLFHVAADGFLHRLEIGATSFLVFFAVGKIFGNFI